MMTIEPTLESIALNAIEAINQVEELEQNIRRQTYYDLLRDVDTWPDDDDNHRDHMRAYLEMKIEEANAQRSRKQPPIDRRELVDELPDDPDKAKTVALPKYDARDALPTHSLEAHKPAIAMMFDDIQHLTDNGVISDLEGIALVFGGMEHFIEMGGHTIPWPEGRKGRPNFDIVAAYIQDDVSERPLAYVELNRDELRTAKNITARRVKKLWLSARDKRKKYQKRQKR